VRKLLNFRAFQKPKNISEIAEKPKFGAALEQRVLLDAALVETASESLDFSGEAQAWTNSSDASELAQDDTFVLGALLSAEAEDVAPEEIIFVDAGVDGLAELIQTIDPDAHLVLLDPNLDGVEQIVDVVSQHDNLAAIHILSHGSEGSLRLGNSILSVDSMAGEYSQALATLGNSLHQDGDILIYGCNFGDTAARALANATSADIAASDDVTGAAARGGDWDLEVVYGEIETETLEYQDYDGTLYGFQESGGVVSINADTSNATVGANWNVVANAGAINGQVVSSNEYDV